MNLRQEVAVVVRMCAVTRECPNRSSSVATIDVVEYD